MANKILVVAAHPDDETLGCGGTLLKHKKEKDNIYWLIMSKMFETNGFTKKRIKAREKEIEAVARAYGFLDVFNLDLPSARFDTIPLVEIIKGIRRVMKKIKAEIIYLPHGGDFHTDHQIAHKAVIASAKPFRLLTVKKILAYETLSETEFAAPYEKNAFMPNVFIDITPFMKKKIEIMELYKGEIKQFPFPRSKKNLRAIATFRGSMMGTYYAEAFVLIREHVRR